MALFAGLPISTRVPANLEVSAAWRKTRRPAERHVSMTCGARLSTSIHIHHLKLLDAMEESAISCIVDRSSEKTTRSSRSERTRSGSHEFTITMSRVFTSGIDVIRAMRFSVELKSVVQLMTSESSTRLGSILINSSVNDELFPAITSRFDDLCNSLVASGSFSLFPKSRLRLI